jgi:hypothetical protein
VVVADGWPRLHGQIVFLRIKVEEGSGKQAGFFRDFLARLNANGNITVRWRGTPLTGLRLQWSQYAHVCRSPAIQTTRTTRSPSALLRKCAPVRAWRPTPQR